MTDPPISVVCAYIECYSQLVAEECSILPCAVCWQSSFWLTQCVCLMEWEATSLSPILVTDVRIQLNKGYLSLYTPTIPTGYRVNFLASYMFMYVYVYVKTNLLHLT